MAIWVSLSDGSEVEHVAYRFCAECGSTGEYSEEGYRSLCSAEGAFHPSVLVQNPVVHEWPDGSLVVLAPDGSLATYPARSWRHWRAD